jgi:hypothetical protein
MSGRSLKSHRLQVGGVRALGGGGWVDLIPAAVAGCLAAPMTGTKEAEVSSTLAASGDWRPKLEPARGDRGSCARACMGNERKYGGESGFQELISGDSARWKAEQECWTKRRT